MDTAKLTVLPAGLVERATRMQLRSHGTNGKYIVKWFDVVADRYGWAYARRLFEVSRRRAERN